MDVPQFIAGRFRIECEIGTGGMGTVYRATHLGLERPVAVKIIKQEFAADRDVADRFLREARTMARLRHTHAAMIFDAGNLPDGRHFIIMEFVEGATLSQALVREKRFSAEQAVKIAVQICEVLEEAHQLGIIHRDLKPSNIMLNERGVRVLDFGVAKVLVSADTTATHATTGSGQIVGTPRYMSPEQCLGQRVGARSDLYSLGVVLYEMLAGRPPFVDALPSAVLVKQAVAPPPPLPQQRPDIPKQLALVVHSLLAKRPEDRPRTAAAARTLLEKSLVQRERELPQSDPFSSTLAVVAERSNIVFRLVAPLATVIFLGALLFVWGGNVETASQAGTNVLTASEMSSESTSETSDSEELSTPSRGLANSLTRTGGRATPVALDVARAESIAAAVSRNTVRDVQVLNTATGGMVAAIKAARRGGLSRFFVMERRGAAFRILARGQLDNKTFQHGQWKAEKVDANGDDFDEVLFSGIKRNGRASHHRFVLYSPRERQAYVLEVQSSGRIGTPFKTVWSNNLLSARTADYRRVLRARANIAVAKLRTR
ncbi:MAG TPA: serine/threonine-protein kinase [Pyrinomonadaceae bacterium]|nr:serine/threonine-protein kinase [Pyrinomonadaceae bacterium]